MLFFILVSLSIGIIIGVFVTFSFIDINARKVLRQRIVKESQAAISASRHFIECRKEKRVALGGPRVVITAPILDTAGVAMVGEFEQLITLMLDVSKHGIAVVSKQFFKVGTILELKCNDDQCVFTRRAQVRNIILVPNGLRVGLEFLEPLEKY